MSDTSLDARITEIDTHYGGDINDYIALLKPRVMSLVVFTAFVGMITAPGHLHPLIMFTALISIAVGAGASGALNMWYDADIDGQMQRTAARPIPRGRVTPEGALSFGIVLSLFSVLTLGLLVNIVAGALLAFTILFYIFIYTIWLKRRTPQNIVIGGAAGAFPPMIGWAAVTGSVSLESIILFLIIFMWTPPHFWALALYRARDYERVGVPMLPVVAGEKETKKQIFIYSALLVPITLLPSVVGLGGVLYTLTAMVLGGILLRLAWVVYTQKTDRQKTDSNVSIQAAKRLFSFSIFYLFGLFAMLLVEYSLGLHLKFDVLGLGFLGFEMLTGAFGV